jgi:SSS family solute:Na+ symporter
MVQRVLGAKTPWDGLMGVIFSCFINILRPLVTCFLGFIIFHWIYNMKMAPPLESHDIAFPFALKTFTPSGVRGIVLAGFMAAVMSTVSALANSTATIFTIDIYKRFINKSANDKKQVFIGRITCFAALVIAASVAKPLIERGGGIFQYFQMGITYLATPFISILILGIFWKRANNQGALFGLIGGVIIQTAVVLVDKNIFHWNLHWFYHAFIAQILIMVGVVIVSLFFSAPPEETWRPLLWRPKLFLKMYKEINYQKKWYQHLIFWYAMYAIIWFAIYIKLW